MDGILRCSRYSFGPNRLHYCGPDRSASEMGVESFLRQFKTLYPYLNLIARSNNIADPFDDRVVEAYWLGNELLENVGKERLYTFLIDDLEIKKKAKAKEMGWIERKIGERAVPHHSFHVLNLWRQTSDNQVAQSLKGLSECCINAGKILSVKGPEIVVETEPLIFLNGKIIMGEPTKKTLTRQLEAEYDIEQVVPGQIISFHWGVPCEVLTPLQAHNLKKYTLQNIKFTNETI